MAQQLTDVLILASGGLDSTACIFYYLERGYRLKTLWINYGQQAAQPELQAISSIAHHYRVELQIVTVSGMDWRVDVISGDEEYVGRNSMLASVGLSAFPSKSGLLAMGIHSDSFYPDCSAAFLDGMSQVATIVTGGRISLDFPFRDWTKKEIAEFCIRSEVPVELTYSCLLGSIPPCDSCSSCQDRRRIGV